MPTGNGTLFDSKQIMVTAFDLKRNHSIELDFIYIAHGINNNRSYRFARAKFICLVVLNPKTHEMKTESGATSII